jgi:hypothetical protein
MFYHNLPAVPAETLWTLLDRIGLPDSAGSPPLTLAVHDSCTARHETLLHDSVRSILGRLGHRVEELPFSRETTVCCGYGGLMMFADREVARKVAARRVAESPADYVTYCAMCRDNFAARGKRAIYLLDLMFAADAEKLTARESPGYSLRRENRARLKRELLRDLWGDAVEEPQGEVKVIIADDVKRIMGDRMILVTDVAAVIAHAEATGDKFRDAGGTFWPAIGRSASPTGWNTRPTETVSWSTTPTATGSKSFTSGGKAWTRSNWNV